jgi:hypothetical protein
LQPFYRIFCLRLHYTGSAALRSAEHRMLLRELFSRAVSSPFHAACWPGCQWQVEQLPPEQLEHPDPDEEPSPLRVERANRLTSLCTSGLPQSGHEGRCSDERMSSSNVSPHLSQLYSNIGMLLIPFKKPDDT